MFARRYYRWTELWLLVLPALFMLVGLFEWLIVPTTFRCDQTTPTSITQPPLEAFTPVLLFIAVLAGAHLLLNIIAPDADQTLLPLAGTLSGIGILMATRLGPCVARDGGTLGLKQLAWVLVGPGSCVLTVRITRDLRWL